MTVLRRILITAGPTREMLDPVRFISNLSTGEMGYTLARIAKASGREVTLISGPTSLKPPKGVRFVPITSADEMYRACHKLLPQHDALIMTAAVADFTAAKRQPQKIKRTKTRQLLIRQTKDILASLAPVKGKRLVIGFCLETENWIENALDKIKRKKLDGIVANYYTKKHVPFGARKITTAFINKEGEMMKLVQQSKAMISKRLLAWAEAFAKSKSIL